MPPFKAGIVAVPWMTSVLNEKPFTLNCTSIGHNIFGLSQSTSEIEQLSIGVWQIALEHPFISHQLQYILSNNSTVKPILCAHHPWHAQSAPLRAHMSVCPKRRFRPLDAFRADFANTGEPIIAVSPPVHRYKIHQPYILENCSGMTGPHRNSLIIVSRNQKSFAWTNEIFHLIIEYLCIWHKASYR